MELKTEPPLAEIPNSRGKYIVPALLLCLALSLIESYMSFEKLETAKRNNEILAQEIRSLEEQNYQRAKNNLVLLKETREVLRECLAVYKANP